MKVLPYSNQNMTSHANDQDEAIFGIKSFKNCKN